MADTGSKNVTLTEDIVALESELANLNGMLRAAVLNEPPSPSKNSPIDAQPLQANRFRNLQERVEGATLLVKDMQVFVTNEVVMRF